MEEIQNQLYYEGYQDWYSPLDAEVVQEVNDGKCKCGGTMHFQGFIKEDSRRSFAYCDKCEEVDEF